MKIEKGKLYYNTALGKIFKATHSHEIKEGLLTNKIAVHCLTKDGKLYVAEKYNLVTISEFSSDYILINEDDACGNDYDGLKLYHIISIDQFKEFYPEEPKLSLPIVDNTNIDNIIEALKIQTQLDYSIESIERELSRLKELKQKINNILK